MLFADTCQKSTSQVDFRCAYPSLVRAREGASSRLDSRTARNTAILSPASRSSPCFHPSAMPLGQEFALPREKSFRQSFHGLAYRFTASSRNAPHQAA